MDNEEFEAGLRCVAAPVRDRTGSVVAAISIAGLSFRVTAGRLPQISRDVMKLAADLSAGLGYAPEMRGVRATIQPADKQAVCQAVILIASEG